MRRLGLIADIHGNLVALDAVLGDIRDCGLREVYCLGDLVGYGPEPAGVIDRVRARGIPTILGNYDDGVGNRRGECGCYYANEQARRDGEASYVFTSAAIDDERAAWLAALPSEIRFEEAGLRFLLTHGSPRKINEYLLPDRTDAHLAKLATAAEADVVCVGHVHVPYHRMVPESNGALHFVSCGSVGKPKDGDHRACWTELLIGSADEVRGATDDPHAGAAGTTDSWVGLVVHRVPYDMDSVERAMLRAGLPPTLAAALRSA
jgi:predicted phosphodiesterase